MGDNNKIDYWQEKYYCKLRNIKKATKYVNAFSHAYRKALYIPLWNLGTTGSINLFKL